MKALKPGYDPEAVQKELVDQVCAYFGRVFDDAEREKVALLRGCRNLEKRAQVLGFDSNGNIRPSLNDTAKHFNMNPQKIRKLLVTVTGGMYNTAEYREVTSLYKAGMTAEQIAEKLHVTPTVISTYIPYRRVIYKLEERSVNADRVRRMRERRKEATS